jgi:predicted CXXCH cytochrome family protein
MKIGLGALALTAVWALAPPAATAGIVGTDHDLKATAPGGQICIACHAPHHVPNTPLLWNHTLSAASFSWSDMTATTGGTPLPANIKTWSGSTKMCLSCHDGSVAIGSIYSTGATFNATKITGSHQIGAGGDLKGNHPVAVPYPFGGVANTYNALTTGANALTSGWVAAPTKVKLFADGVPTPTNRGMECASCHNPHDDTNSPFLRDTSAGSALCLDCHVK